MTYSNHAFQYDHYEGRETATEERSTRSSRARTNRTTRRRTRRRTTTTPGVGMAARRGRRWGF